MIPTRVHGIIDYVVAALLIVSPFIFGFADGGPAQWVPMLLGASIVVYSLLTRYEVSAVKLIPMPVHLGLDAIGGLLLVASPWLFGFADVIWWPHVLVGIAELGVTALTKRRPDAVDAV